MSRLYHQVTLLLLEHTNTGLSVKRLPCFPTAAWLIPHVTSALIDPLQSLRPSLGPTEPTSLLVAASMVPWRRGWNDAELYLPRVWPKVIKLPPQTRFSFPLLARRCLRNVMISVTFTLLEVEDYPHHLIVPLYYYSLMLCFSRSCGPTHYPCGK